MENRSDIYQRVTNQIIAAIEAGAEKWEMPWHTNGRLGLPSNVASGRTYRGVNTLLLWAVAHQSGYSSPTWGTYKQWAEKGCQVRKGAYSACVLFWKPLDGDQSETADNPNAGETNPRFVARAYSVFNADQVDGYESEELPLLSQLQRIEHAEAFFQATGADIRQGGGRALYSPKTDYIQIPDFAAFRDPVAYYSVLAHEATHWTGAASRCGRDLSGRFGTEAHAAEELIAELGAAFLCADLRLAAEPRPDHASYVETWLKVLKDDKRAIFVAASKAQQAADWMHARQPNDLEKTRAA